MTVAFADGVRVGRGFRNCRSRFRRCSAPCGCWLLSCFSPPLWRCSRLCGRQHTGRTVNNAGPDFPALLGPESLVWIDASGPSRRQVRRARSRARQRTHHDRERRRIGHIVHLPSGATACVEWTILPDASRCRGDGAVVSAAARARAERYRSQKARLGLRHYAGDADCRRAGSPAAPGWRDGSGRGASGRRRCRPDAPYASRLEVPVHDGADPEHDQTRWTGFRTSTRRFPKSSRTGGRQWCVRATPATR